MKKEGFFAVLGVLFFAVASRLIPHPWGVTAIGGASLFCGFYIKDNALKYVLPLLAMLISDMFLGFHSTMLFVYSGLVLIIFLGSSVKTLKLNNWLLTTVFSSLVFFAITNFGVWALNAYYANTTLGLLECYLMGIPFLEKQVVGDLIFSGIFFGTYKLALRFQDTAIFPSRQ